MTTQQLQADLQECNMFFVYGTLRIGFSNHPVLGGAPYQGDAVSVDPFYMVGYGVPVIFKGGDKKIFGELYRVKNVEILKNLDRLEGHPTLYRREIIKVTDESGNEVDAWCYIVNNRTGYPHPYLTEVEHFGSVQIF